MCPFHSKFLLLGQFRPLGHLQLLTTWEGSSLLISGYDVLLLTAEIGLTINILLWNWHIVYPTSDHDELPLCRRKETINVQSIVSAPLLARLYILVVIVRGRLARPGHLWVCGPKNDYLSLGQRLLWAVNLIN